MKDKYDYSGERFLDKIFRDLCKSLQYNEEEKYNGQRKKLKLFDNKNPQLFDVSDTKILEDDFNRIEDQEEKNYNDNMFLDNLFKLMVDSSDENINHITHYSDEEVRENLTVLERKHNKYKGMSREKKIKSYLDKLERIYSKANTERKKEILKSTYQIIL